MKLQWYSLSFLLGNLGPKRTKSHYLCEWSLDREHYWLHVLSGLNYQITSHSAPCVYISLSFEYCQHQFHLGKGLEIGWAQTFPSLSNEHITILLALWGQTDQCKHLTIPVHGTKPFSSSVFVVTVASLVFGLLLSCGTPYVPACNRVLTLHVNVADY